MHMQICHTTINLLYNPECIHKLALVSCQASKFTGYRTNKTRFVPKKLAIVTGDDNVAQSNREDILMELSAPIT